MEHYYNSENFDITHLIEKFEGKKIEDISDISSFNETIIACLFSFILL